MSTNAEFAANTPNDVMTVSALNRQVAGNLLRAFPLVRVEGEIAGLARATSGHWYFTLKDASAQVRCVMFRGRNVLVGFTVKDGDHLRLLAKVGLFEPRGDFQLSVEALERTGAGRLYEEFLRRRTRFDVEGLFDSGRKRRAMAVPRAIGIVTSLQAAALLDVISTLARRAPYATLVVYPVPVQGAEAAARIAHAVSLANTRAEVDTLLLVRGGGSIEDLWAFNEDVVVRAVAASTIPIIVGVGHESDVTLADMAADVRAPTPTSAAELAACDVAVLRIAITEASRRARQSLSRLQLVRAQRVDYAARALAGRLAPLVSVMMRIAQMKERASLALMTSYRMQHSHYAESVRELRRQRQLVNRFATHLDASIRRVQLVQKRSTNISASQLALLVGTLRGLNPLAVLDRGFSLVTNASGRVITNAREASLHARLSVRFSRGAAEVVVTATSDDVSDDQIFAPTNVF